ANIEVKMKGIFLKNLGKNSAFLLFAICWFFLQSAVSFAQATVSFGTATNFVLASKSYSVALGDFNGDGQPDLAVANGGDTSTTPLLPGTVSILLADDTGKLGAATNFSVGTIPYSVTVGDFNGDGKLDLAVANSGSNNVSVLLGHGDGTFGPATNFSAGAGARFVAVGDFNGDGKLDLAVANAGDRSTSFVIGGSLAILLGNGDGTFGAAMTMDFPAGSIPTAVAVEDFNGDGRLDVAVANGGSNTVSILLGNGDGTFGAATNFTAGTGPVDVRAADFDGDGKIDLAVVNSGGNNVSILLGTGTGSFGTAKNFAVGNQPVSLTVGDFDGDGNLDLAVANSALNNLSILRGKGDGNFFAAANCCTGSLPWSVAAEDFNGDGKLDLVVALYNNAVSILLGDGTGSFGAVKTYIVGAIPVSLAIGDFNGDGKLDLAMEEITLLGDGDGTFPNATNYTVGAGPVSVAVGDFNGDGKLDLAVVNADSDNVSILLGTGTGTFGAATNFAVGTNPASVAVGDFNGDGKKDLAVANSGDNSVVPAVAGSLSILLGNGDGTFGTHTSIPVGTSPVAVAVGDFNGNGKLDLAVVNAGNSSANPAIAGSLSVLLGNGDGTFGATTNYTVGTTPTGVALGDFNLDGKLDLAVVNSASNDVSILVGKGDGTFGAAASYAAGSGAHSVAVGDLNGDGRLDLAVANAVGKSVSILLNTTTNPAASHTLTVQSSNPITGVSMTVTPKDKNNQSNGPTPFTRTYVEGTTVTLTAAATSGGNNFVAWSSCTSAVGAKCSVALTTDKTVTATYGPPLTVAGSKLPDMEVGVSYDTPLVTDGVGPFTFKATKGTFPPPGLYGDQTNGHLAGFSTSSNKKVSFTVLITDSLGSSVTAAFKATGYAAVSISTKSLKAGTHGKAYKGKLAAAGGKKPFDWSETSGNLTAAGLTLDPATGSISGTPAGTGVFTFDFQVTDSLGGIGQKSLTLTIN
ncbi:MAG: FG-GAP-like repeat-containing protein, partial [Alphaproteobacteria bacterium]